MSERLMVRLPKSRVGKTHREFESHSLRQGKDCLNCSRPTLQTARNSKNGPYCFGNTGHFFITSAILPPSAVQNLIENQKVRKMGKMKLSDRFQMQLDKIKNKGCIIDTRKSHIYLLSVNRNGFFCITEYSYNMTNGVIYSRYYVNQWTYDSADAALAKFEEIKSKQGMKFENRNKFTYT